MTLGGSIFLQLWVWVPYGTIVFRAVPPLQMCWRGCTGHSGLHCEARPSDGASGSLDTYCTLTATCLLVLYSAYMYCILPTCTVYYLRTCTVYCLHVLYTAYMYCILPTCTVYCLHVLYTTYVHVLYTAYMYCILPTCTVYCVDVLYTTYMYCILPTYMYCILPTCTVYCLHVLYTAYLCCIYTAYMYFSIHHACSRHMTGVGVFVLVVA